MKEYKLPIGCDVPETIILADGDFPSHPLALEGLRQCPYEFVVTGQQILILVQVECRKPLLAMVILYCRVLKSDMLR